MKLENVVCVRCKGTYIRYSMAENDFCCWDCGSKEYETLEKETAMKTTRNIHAHSLSDKAYRPRVVRLKNKVLPRKAKHRKNQD